MYRTDLLTSVEKVNLTDKINLSEPPNLDIKYTINQFFNLQDPLDNIPLSRTEIESIFLLATEKMALELLESYQNI